MKLKIEFGKDGAYSCFIGKRKSDAAKFISRILHDHNIHMNELVKISGRSQRTCYMYIRGELDIPAEVMIALCKRCEIEVIV